MTKRRRARRGKGRKRDDTMDQHRPGPVAEAPGQTESSDAHSYPAGSNRSFTQALHSGDGDAVRMLRQPPNRAVARATTSPARRPNGSVHLQRSLDQEFGQQAADDDSRFALRMISDWTRVDVDDRMQIVHNLLEDYWVGPFTEGTIEDIWNSLGRSGIEAKLDQGRYYQNLWKRSIDHGAELADIPCLSGMRAAFERDVRTLANSFMTQNKDLVEQEQANLGISVEGYSPASEEESAERVAEIQELVESLEEIKVLQEQLKTITVGRRAQTQNELHMQARAAGTSLIDYDFEGPPVTFDPAGPPSYGPREDDEGFQEWEDVKRNWDQLGLALTMVANASPAVYGAMVDDRLEDISVDQSPAQAQAAMTELLGTMHGNVTATITALATDDLDWRELAPIHALLYSGQPAEAQYNWSSTLMKSIGEDIVGDYKDNQFWVSLGLGTLAAAAFIFSNIATAGWATVAWAAVGIGASATTAAMSWESYDDLRTAADAGASSETEVVSEGQADAALVQAIIDTVFAFVDLATPFRPLGRIGAALAQRGARVAGREAAELSLRGLSEMGPVEARAAIEQSIREVGIAETLTRSGLDEVQLLARSDGSEVVSRALMNMAEFGIMSRRNLAAQMRRLADLPMANRENVAATFFDLFGAERTLREAGGWSKLAQALGNESATGTALVAWRDSAFQDLRHFVEETLGGQIQRTGRSGSFTNDLDFSLLGENAVANAERARTFLAARTGTDAAGVERLLDAGILTDPTRSHIYDLLDTGSGVLRETTAERVMRLEEELVFARRLHDARGDDIIAAAIRQEMEEAGISEVPWRQLSTGERGQLATQIDGLHSRFLEAQAAGDSVAAATLAEEIAQKQALLNASSPGAYYTGGSVRRWVSERDAIEGFGTAARPPTLTPQRIADIGNQTDELHHAVREMLNESAGDVDIAGLLKKFGKYGDRLSTSAAEAASATSSQWTTTFEELAQRFQTFQTAFESGALGTLSRSELMEVRGNAFRLLGELSYHSGDFVAVLRRDLGPAAAEGAGLAVVQRAVRNHLALQRASRALRNAILKKLARILSAHVGVPEIDDVGPAGAEP